jgi:hypothetical protein
MSFDTVKVYGILIQKRPAKRVFAVMAEQFCYTSQKSAICPFFCRDLLGTNCIPFTVNEALKGFYLFNSVKTEFYSPITSIVLDLFFSRKSLPNHFPAVRLICTKILAWAYWTRGKEEILTNTLDPILLISLSIWLR